MLQPLTNLASNMVEVKWIYIQPKALDEIKRIGSCNTSLDFTYFNEWFDIHTDTKHLKKGAVIKK